MNWIRIQIRIFLNSDLNPDAGFFMTKTKQNFACCKIYNLPIDQNAHISTNVSIEALKLF